jgi:hypothetical protein
LITAYNGPVDWKKTRPRSTLYFNALSTGKKGAVKSKKQKLSHKMFAFLVTQRNVPAPDHRGSDLPYALSPPQKLDCLVGPVDDPNRWGDGLLDRDVLLSDPSGWPHQGGETLVVGYG